MNLSGFLQKTLIPCTAMKVMKCHGMYLNLVVEIEQTVPWNEIKRQNVSAVKISREVQTFLNMDNPEYKIYQITLVIDVFGGYSKNV